MAENKRNKSTGGKPKAKAGKQKQKRKSRPHKDLVNYGYMKALSKKERVEIFAIICERIASPNEISKELGEGLSQVSYHVKVLRESHLIVIDHEVPRRGAVEHFYRAATPTLIPPGAWKQLPPSVRRGVSLGILQEFFEDASAALKAGIFDDSPGELNWTPLILDPEGVEEFGKLARGFLGSVLDLQANVSKRLPRDKGKTGEAKAATVFLATFLSARSATDGKKASATRRR
jgi:DNA-binding transcriptional ArsR family regulator